MGIFDSMKDKAEELLGGAHDAAEDAAEKAQEQAEDGGGLLDKVKGMVSGHEDQVESLSDQGISKAGDAIDSATGGQFSDQIDQAQQVADDKIGQ